MADVQQTVAQVARAAYGKLIAYLSARTRDVAAAEDALGEALLDALRRWPGDGVPQQPEAWLLQAARHRLLDDQRHQRMRERHAEVLRSMAVGAAQCEGGDALPDERLRLLFVCAHPAIDVAVHAPLMLQVVLGLDAARIAPSFLMSPAAMGKRLVRAKTKIREAGIPFVVPVEAQRGERLESVLEAIYAAYGLGWDGAPLRGADARDLADEALWLARTAVQCLPDEPEALGLLALVLHCEARRATRRSADGDYVPLSAQDPTRWSVPLRREAEATLLRAAQLGRPSGRFQLEAAIQSVHADRARTGRTDWAAIVMFYGHLLEIASTLGARIGAAVATAELHGAAAGLALLDAIDADVTADTSRSGRRAHSCSTRSDGATRRGARSTWRSVWPRTRRCGVTCCVGAAERPNPASGRASRHEFCAAMSNGGSVVRHAGGGAVSAPRTTRTPRPCAQPA